MSIVTENIVDNTIEQEYSNSTSIEHRKEFAQFFTPPPLVQLMGNWLLQNEHLETTLEPAFGLGIFSRFLLSQKKEIKIKGYEIDPEIYSKSKSIFADKNQVDIILEDYMTNDWNNKYDGIICNPPYFKFHDYDNKSTIKELEKNIGTKFNAFSNLYSLFLVKSVSQLNDGGRLAYIIPSEFLNSDYGVSIKEYLKKKNILRYVLVVDFKENVFDDALTTASILLCANDKEIDEIQFKTLDTLSDLDEIELEIERYPTISGKTNTITNQDLKPEIKWRGYYQELNSDKFKNLVPFSTFGKVVRGIATGANDYFKFNESKSKNFSITNEHLLPCITKSSDINTIIFTKNDFDELKENDKSVFLFNARDPYSKNVSDYIKKGELEGINDKYLTSKRNPWYSLENRPPSPIWVSVFNRNGLKFIRNEANVSNLTCFHCIYPVKKELFSDIEIDLLFAYLLTDTAKAIFTDNSREYGNGLQKFEPNDLNKSKVLDLRLLNPSTKRLILEYYYSYRNSVLDKNENKDYIDYINDLLIDEFSK